MTKPEVKVLCVVNPVSANGRTRRVWRSLDQYMRKQGLVYDVQFTSRPKEASDITRQALYSSYNRIVAVGGDGTVNEVVNGFFNGDAAPINGMASLSVVPMGTGGDFSRMLALSSAPKVVTTLMNSGREITIDLVRAKFTGWDGQAESRYFINIADVGLGSETCYWVNRSSKVLGGFFSFLLGAVYSICTFKNRYLTVTIDDVEVYSGLSSLVAVGNGSYFGGGMKIAPTAKIDDGQLDIVIVKDLKKLDLIANIPKIYSGKHLDHPGVQLVGGKKVKIISPEKIYLEIDGESPGQGDIELEIIPSGMKMLV